MLSSGGTASGVGWAVVGAGKIGTDIAEGSAGVLIADGSMGIFGCSTISFALAALSPCASLSFISIYYQPLLVSPVKTVSNFPLTQPYYSSMIALAFL
jgi:hypothetical protein